jgi:DNA-binding beta-propeller fold protein YncE
MTMRTSTLPLLALLLLPALPSIAQQAELIAGGGTGPDGSIATKAKLEKPFGVDRDSKGNLLIIDFLGHLRAVTPDGRLITLCGSTKGDSGDGGPADKAQLNTPHSLAVGPGGDIYIADTLNHRIRKIDAATGIISTVAGTTKGFSGDNGPADKAQFNGIYCIAFNPDQTKLVITDLENRRIRVIDMKTKIVTTAAGNGTRGVPKDSESAVTQPLVDPRAAAMDSKGNLYVLERGDHSLRVVDSAGQIRTLIPGPAKKGGPHVLAGPKHLAIDKNDDVLIADTDNHRIVLWQVKEQKVTPIAGMGTLGTEGIGGPPLQLRLNQPHGVFVDKDGGIFVSDSWNGRVVRIAR